MSRLILLLFLSLQLSAQTENIQISPTTVTPVGYYYAPEDGNPNKLFDGDTTTGWVLSNTKKGQYRLVIDLGQVYKLHSIGFHDGLGNIPIYVRLHDTFPQPAAAGTITNNLELGPAVGFPSERTYFWWIMPCLYTTARYLEVFYLKHPGIGIIPITEMKIFKTQ